MSNLLIINNEKAQSGFDALNKLGELERMERIPVPQAGCQRVKT